MRTKRTRPRTLATACLLSLLFLPDAAAGQYARPPAPPAYALEGATWVHPDGRQESGVTLVVRGRFIEALGPGVQVPPDATVLEGDSLYLYAGIVDAHGSVQPEFPEAETDDPPPAWAPTRSAQGFTPHRMAAHHLAASGDDLSATRKRGVVASGVLPDDGMAAGVGAAVIHRAGAGNGWALVANPSLGVSMGFRAAGGVYPSTIFGVIAALRQAFLDAQHARAVSAAFASNPRGVTPPAFDPDLQALNRALEGDLPVYFAADGAEDIRRVLRLVDEFGFRAVIVGGEEAGELARELARRRIPVLFSVDFDTPSEWDPDSEDPLTPAAEREKERLEAIYAGPARLAEAGVTFALTSGGSGSDLLPGVRKAVSYGLSEADAMAAVTTTPAAMLGVPEVVRVEEGMAATFIVTDGPLLEEETKVVYTFVEGALEEGTSAGGGEAPAANLSGEWEMTVNAQGMEVAMEMTLTQSGSELSGSLTSADMGNSTITGGTVSGSNVTMEITAEGLPEPLVFTGTMNSDGTRISGSASTPFGELTFTARKKPGASDQGGAR